MLFRSDADGVDLHAERGGELRGGHGINLAFIIVAVGEQDDDSALALLLIFEPLRAGDCGIADGGADLVDRADVQPSEILHKPVVIHRERTAQIRHT